MPDDSPRWLDPDAAARYLSVRVDFLGRLVRQKRIPAPSYRLGARSPRWDRLALDAMFDGGAASTDTALACQGLADAIKADGKALRARREARPHRAPILCQITGVLPSLPDPVKVTR